MKLQEKFEQHWLGALLLVAVVVAGVAWAVLNELLVRPRDEEKKRLQDHIAKLENREQARPDAADQRHSAASKSEKPNCNEYEISITDPTGPVTPPFEVSGYSKPLPNGFELWLATVLRPGSGEAYWPKAPSPVKGNNWRVRVSPEGLKSGETKHYAVFVVGEDGQKLFRYYKTVKGSAPLTELTSDSARCGTVHEVRIE